MVLVVSMDVSSDFVLLHHSQLGETRPHLLVIVMGMTRAEMNDIRGEEKVRGRRC